MTRLPLILGVPYFAIALTGPAVVSHEEHGTYIAPCDELPIPLEGGGGEDDGEQR